MGMLVSGIAACEAIDSSGEIVKIDGLDISSLERDGVLNVEHESKSITNIVGKILKSKKIFSEKDCENENQLKFWKQVKVPYLWIVAELFDDVGHTEAQNIAALMRYDQKAKKEGKYKNDMAQLINFSVEGAKLRKEANIVVRSIARKVSITITPCNKVAEAEIYEPQTPSAKPMETKKNSKLPDMNIFKSETLNLPSADVTEENDLEKKEQLLSKSTVLGRTKSGKDIHSHMDSGYHRNFDMQEHKDAMNVHYKAFESARDPKTKSHHLNMTKLHQKGMIAKEPRAKPNAPISNFNTKNLAQTKNPYSNISERPFKKAMTLGSSAGAPSTLTGAAALGKEDLKGKVEELSKASSKGKLLGSAPTKEQLTDGIKKFYYGTEVTLHPHADGHHEVHNSKGKIDGVKVREHKGRWRFEQHEDKSDLKKSQVVREMNKQIDSALESWEKVEQFRKFLSEKAPNLSKKEVEAFTRTFAMYRIKKAENKLKKI